MIRSKLASIGVLAIASFLIAGCGGINDTPSVAKTTGTVTYQGKPVAGASVTFIKEGASRGGTGTTNAEGRFEISTFANNDGAIIGDHVVTIVKRAAPAAAAPPASGSTDIADMGKKMQAAYEQQAANAAAKKDELPARYANPEASGLKAIVSPDASKNDFKFELVD